MSEACSAFQRPSAPSQVMFGGDGVDVKVGIEFAAGVVVIYGNDQVARGAVFIGAVLADAGGSVGFEFLQSFANSVLMSLKQAVIAAELGQEGNGFWGGDSEVVNVAAVAFVAPSALLDRHFGAGAGIRRSGGSRPSRIASNWSDVTSPERPSISASRPCH